MIIVDEIDQLISALIWRQMDLKKSHNYAEIDQ